MRLLTTAPTSREAVTREEVRTYLREVMRAEPLPRRRPQPAPKITDWTLFRAWIDSRTVARRIRADRRQERLLAQAALARTNVTAASMAPVQSVVLAAPWRQ